jgi:hypothetical protein
VGYTENPFIFMGQQVSRGENGYFPTVNGGSLQYQVPTKSAKVCEIYEKPIYGLM